MDGWVGRKVYMDGTTGPFGRSISKYDDPDGVGKLVHFSNLAVVISSSKRLVFERGSDRVLLTKSSS